MVNIIGKIKNFILFEFKIRSFVYRYLKMQYIFRYIIDSKNVID